MPKKDINKKKYAPQLARLLELQSQVSDKRKGKIYVFANPTKDGKEYLGCSIASDGRSCGYQVITKPSEKQICKKFGVYEEVFDIYGRSLDRIFLYKYPDGFELVYVSLKQIKKASHKKFQKAWVLNQIRREIAEIELEFRQVNYSWKDDANYAKKRKGTI